MKSIGKGMSKRFVVINTAIMAGIILAMAIGFAASLNLNQSVLKSVLLRYEEPILLEKASFVRERIASSPDARYAAPGAILRRSLSGDHSVLNAILFRQSQDENYYTVVDVIQTDRAFDPGVRTGETVREDRGENYLEKGMFGPVVDPSIRTRGSVNWRTLYFPFDVRGRTHVVRLAVSASQAINALDEHERSTDQIKRYTLYAIALAALLMLVIMSFFAINFSLLISGISGSLKRVSSGEMVNGMDTHGDGDLEELAESFNCLVEEMKELRERGSRAVEEERVNAGELFRRGVTDLKDGNLEDAIAMFRTLLVFNPSSFGSFFNLGVAYAKKREYDVSIQMFRKAAAVNPSHELTSSYIERVERLQSEHGQNTV